MAQIWGRIMLTILAGCGGIAMLFMSGVEMKDSIKDRDFYGIFLMAICIVISLALITIGVKVASGLLV